MDWKLMDQQKADEEQCEQYENQKKIINNEMGKINYILG